VIIFIFAIDPILRDISN